MFGAEVRPQERRPPRSCRRARRARPPGSSTRSTCTDCEEPLLREQRHHRGAVNASGRSIVPGWRLRTCRSAIPRTGRASCAGCRPGTPSRPRRTQCSTTSRSASHSPLPVVGLPVDVVDVLVALGRVLGVLDRPVGPVLEPLRVLLEPRVVRRALERESSAISIPCSRGARDERSEVGVVPRSGVDRVVAPFGGADRPRAADVPRLRALARCCGPCGWCGRSGGSAAGRRRRSRARRAPGRRTRPRETAPGAGEELVPAPNARALALDLELERLARTTP